MRDYGNRSAPGRRSRAELAELADLADLAELADLADLADLARQAWRTGAGDNHYSARRRAHLRFYASEREGKGPEPRRPRGRNHC